MGVGAFSPLPISGLIQTPISIGCVIFRKVSFLGLLKGLGDLTPSQGDWRETDEKQYEGPRGFILGTWKDLEEQPQAFGVQTAYLCLPFFEQSQDFGAQTTYLCLPFFAFQWPKPPKQLIDETLCWDYMLRFQNNII